MIKPTDKKLAILRVLARHHSANPKQLFYSVLQHLNTDEKKYDLKSFYRHIQELEDSNELLSKFFNSDGEEVVDYKTTSGLSKIVYDKASRSKIVGEGLLNLEAGSIYCGSALAPKISFLETISKGSLEKHAIELIFFLNGKIRVLRINNQKTFPLKIIVARKTDFSKNWVLTVERTKDILFLALPHPDLSSFKSADNPGHFQIDLEGNLIKCTDLNSTNGTVYKQLKEEDFLKKCQMFEHLTSKTFRLTESENSEESSSLCRYAHIFITDMTQFLLRL